MGNIKDYRKNELKSYMIGNAIIILLASGLLLKIVSGTSNSVLAMADEVITSTVVSTIFYIYVFLADSVIPGKLKDKICFPDGMPGTSIFSDMIDNPKDVRFTKEQAMEKYFEIYKTLDSMTGLDSKDIAAFQNSQWMKIYRAYESVDRVFVSQKDYLMCRDMCSMTIWVLIVYLTICFLGFISFDWHVFVFLIVEFCLTLVAARNKGTRFAYNVISEDMYNNNKD